MQSLNLPTYSFKIKSEGSRKLIFDPFRKKYVVLTPEEWVRQNFAQFLVHERSVPEGRIAVEKSLLHNNMKRRCDLLVYGDTEAKLMVECKAPDVKISQKVFDQVAVYNLEFKVEYLVVSNGIDHYCCRINFEEEKIEFLKDIPDYKILKS